MRRVFSLALLCALTTGAALAAPTTVVDISTDDTHVHTLPCDVSYGCIIELPPGETLNTAISSDDRMHITPFQGSPVTGTALKIIPVSAYVDTTQGTKPLRAEIDIQSPLHLYSVVATAARDGRVDILRFHAPPAPIAAPVPTATSIPSTAEYEFLDPAGMDFGYHSDACVAAFTVLSRGQLWCKLYHATVSDPNAYVIVRGHEYSVGSRIVAGAYLVVETVSTPLRLRWTDGTTATIVRTHE